jgi:hypothetical protein
MVGPMRVIIAGLLLGALAAPALAFQETTGAAPEAPPAAAAPAADPPKAAIEPGVEPGRGLSLKVPEVSLDKGTEIRIPGIGSVGVLPKLDFGLELLYGANEPKGVPQDRTDQDDVKIRGTIKHRF